MKVPDARCARSVRAGGRSDAARARDLCDSPREVLDNTDRVLGTDAPKVASAGTATPASAYKFWRVHDRHGTRNLRLDLLALGLLVLVVFLTLALLTYSPADPVVELVAPLNNLYQPDVLVYPQNADGRERLRQVGSAGGQHAADRTGAGCILLRRIARHARRAAAAAARNRRAAGAGFRLVRVAGGLTTVAALAVPQLVARSGDRVGRLSGRIGRRTAGNAFCHDRGADPGDSLVLGGLLLSTDYALMHVAPGAGHHRGGVGQRARAAAARRAGHRRRRRPRRGRRAEPAVRVGGVAVDRRGGG